MNYLWFALIIVICYFIGNVNFARLIAKAFRHEDIMAKGSGNPGTMNVLRVYGIGYALLTLILECLKSGIPALVCGYIMAQQNLFEAAFLTAGISVVLGHNFPVFYKFKGGKGIACVAGMFFFSPLWWFALIMFILGTVFLYFIDYAFLASLLFVTVMTIAWSINIGVFQPVLWWVCLIILIFNWLLAVIMHRSNIVRFAKGTENHTNFRSKVNRLFSRKEKIIEMDTPPEKEIIIEDEKDEDLCDQQDNNTLNKD